MKWLISVPIWGTTYANTFINNAAPALRAALMEYQARAKKPLPIQFIIHTDHPSPIKAALDGFEYVDFREPHFDTSYPYVALQRAHADAINSGKIGDRIVLLNADLVVSKNMFTSIDKHFAPDVKTAVPKKAIVLVGIRTNPGHDIPPAGAPSRQLLLWAWSHRHQIIKDLEWGRGTSALPTNLFFSDENAVIAHVFHLHPVAIVKERELQFESTIDGDLLNTFRRDDIHVVTDPDDMSMLEISHPEKRFPCGPALLSMSGVAASMRPRASELHKWFFTHKIVITGDGSKCEVSGIVNGILERIDGIARR